MSKLRTVLDHVLFQFEDELITSQGIKQFKQTTKWGFDLGSNLDHNLKEARWVRVIAVGPDVKEFGEGARVLLEPLKWTEGVAFEGSQYWMTKEENVLCIDEAS